MELMNRPCATRKTASNDAITLTELRAYGKRNQIPGWSNMNKEELCAVLDLEYDQVYDDEEEEEDDSELNNAWAGLANRPCAVRKTESNNAISLTELREYGKRNKIPGWGSMNKEELCAVLDLEYDQVYDDEGEVEVETQAVQTPIQFDPEPDVMGVTLQEHQRLVADTLLQKGVHGLLVQHSLGSGKTITAISAAEALMNRDNKLTAVVIVSAGLIENFQKELRKTGVDVGRFQIMSREMFLRRPCRCKGRILIVDEAHNLKNVQGKISKAVAKCAADAYKVILLTGTPIQNYPHELRGLINMVSRRPVLPDTEKEFKKVYGVDGLEDEDLMTRNLTCKVSMYVTPDTSDDFPSLEFEDVVVTMTDQQTAEYESRENMILTPALARELRSAGREMSSRMMTFLTGPRTWCNVMGGHMPKVFALMDNVKDAVARGEKVLIYSQFLSKGLALIEEALRGEGIEHATFTGKQSKREKGMAITKYNAGRIPVLLVSRAGGEGLDLKQTSQVHIFEPYWNEQAISQVIGRARRYKSHSGPGPHVVSVFRYYATKGDAAGVDTLSADMYLKKLSLGKEDAVREFIETRLKPASIEWNDCSLDL